jgi:CheY-like chemotaxis protein/anti-sigma regulatory factor (Ser/Thr protein kinase)
VEVTWLLQAQANIQGIALTLAYHSALPAYSEGDEARIRQIIFNLVGNAVKFTTEGEVTIVADGVRAADGVWKLTIAVRDTGIGIPADRLAHLFQDFVQVNSADNRKFGGSGLGLAICQRLATLMDGAIQVESTLGAGSTFSFVVELPESAACAGFTALPEAANSHHFLDTHLLLAEDNLVNQKVAIRMLTALGCRVTVAQNGREAVQLAQRENFAVILMDCQMPEMDGFEASRLIRSSVGPEPVIIALTGNALPGDRQRCLEAGMNEYLAKPFQRADLAGLLERHLPVATAADRLA